MSKGRYPGRVYQAFLQAEGVSAADTYYILIDKSDTYLYSHPSSTQVLSLLSLDLESEKASDGEFDIWVGVVHENDTTDGSMGLIHVFHIEAVGNPTDSDDRFSRTVDFTCNGANPEGLDLSTIAEALSSEELTDGGFANWTSDDLDDWTESAATIDAAEETSSVISGSAAKLTATGGTNVYIYENLSLTAGRLYKMQYYYKNTASDVAQIAVYDVTNSANIIARTDLTDSTTWTAVQTSYFIVPTGCTSVSIRPGVKGDGDIVYFDSMSVKQVSTVAAPTYLRGLQVQDDTHLKSAAGGLYSAMSMNWSNDGDTYSAAVGDIIVWVEEVGGTGTLDFALTALYRAH